MKCKEIVKGEAGYLCGDTTRLYACEKCDENSKECQNCIAIPLPSQPKTTYSGIETETYQGIFGYITDKKFLFGFGIGLLAGMFLFRK